MSAELGESFTEKFAANSLIMFFEALKYENLTYKMHFRVKVKIILLPGVHSAPPTLQK